MTEWLNWNESSLPFEVQSFKIHIIESHGAHGWPCFSAHTVIYAIKCAGDAVLSLELYCKLLTLILHVFVHTNKQGQIHQDYHKIYNLFPELLKHEEKNVHVRILELWCILSAEICKEIWCTAPGSYRHLGISSLFIWACKSGIWKTYLHLKRVKLELKKSKQQPFYCSCSCSDDVSTGTFTSWSRAIVLSGLPSEGLWRLHRTEIILFPHAQDSKKSLLLSGYK